ncbi:MAG: hypothetical protein Q8P27_02985, partial [Candidatus Peregrinibacteria bacterium]|nr:hypothetical protein [Candidatus Peregrinibacteria bacterium]
MSYRRIFLLTSSLLALLFLMGCGGDVAEEGVEYEDSAVEKGFEVEEGGNDLGIVVVEPTTTVFYSSELGEIDANLNFKVEIPIEWEVEYVSEISSINFYDPNVSGDSSLEQSQIFVRYFNASSFLTLNTVTIYSEVDSTINGRPAVTYDIEKNAGVANFVSQPSWRNERHFVTDIRSTDDSSTTFYVFGRRPDLDDEVFNSVLESAEFNPIELYYPMDDFEENITL